MNKITRITLVMLLMVVSVNAGDSFSEFMAEQLESKPRVETIHQCSIYKETGLLWGYNTIIGMNIISIIHATKKHSRDEELIVNGNTLHEITNNKFERSQIRVSLIDGYHRPNQIMYETKSFNEVKIETNSKTQWAYCRYIETITK